MLNLAGSNVLTLYLTILYKEYRKKMIQLWHVIVDYRTYYIYAFTFFMAIKIRMIYLSCIIATTNGKIRSDFKMQVEITFFHRWELLAVKLSSAEY